MKRTTFTLISTVSVMALASCASLPMKTNQTAAAQNQQKIAAKLQHSRGLNVEMLLRNEVEQSIQELSQAEQSIAAVRAGMMDVIPSLKRLEELHQDIANLNNRLRSVMNNITVAPVTKDALSTAKPTPIKPEPPKPQVIKPIKTMFDKAKSMTAGKAAIQPMQASPKPAPKQTAVKAAAPKQGVANIRIGDHPGKTRIVLDVYGETKPVYDLDNGEMLMAIELPKTAWNTNQKAAFPKGKLVKGYGVQSIDDGTLIAISLGKETSLMQHFVLKGSATKPARYVFDLKQ